MCQSCGVSPCVVGIVDWRVFEAALDEIINRKDFELGLM
jgi:hypothetical protein